MRGIVRRSSSRPGAPGARGGLVRAASRPLGIALAALLATAGCGESPTGTSNNGTIEVTASTEGQDVDPDGYTLTVDGEESQPIGVNETVTASDVPPGSYVLELVGVAENCSVDGENPRTVRVSGGQTASTTFQLTCSARAGDARVTTTTSGGDPDADGYTVTVDPDADGPSQSIAADGEVTFTGLAEGDHQFQLTGLANNCSVDGENPRTATVAFGQTAEVPFEVTCSSRTGDLEVTASTSGTDPDPDGYTVTVDGTQSQSVASNGTVTFPGLAEGDHDVALEGVENNCTVDGQNPRTVTVPFDGTASTAFDVSCTDAVGDLEVTASTTGQDQDADGYTVTVDGTQSKALASDGAVTFAGLAAGTHSVELTGVAGNCSVDGQNPRDVNVPNGGSASTGFDVSCVEALGDLEVTTSTTGADLDPDGYTVTVSPDRSQSFQPDDTNTFTNLDAGDHDVQLVDLAPNCSVDGQNPRTVTIQAETTVSTTFDVSCTEIPGDLTVSASTSGQDPDPDGYTVTLDGGSARTIGPDGETTYSDIASTEHTVELDASTVANNCSIDSTNPRTPTVPEGGSITVDFAVSCSDAVGDLVVDVSTSGTDPDPTGYTVTVDGTQSKAVGPTGSVTFTDLSAETHSVELTDVAGNCTVSGSNPRNVNVPNGGSATENVDVSCTEALGDLEVDASTTGQDPDPDGYDVEVTDPVTSSTTTQSVGPQGTTTFQDLDTEEGGKDYQVELLSGSVAGNCSVSGDNLRTVTVNHGETAPVSFTVECTARTGSIEVTASTTGDDQDDQYDVLVDGSPVGTIGANATATFPDIDEGTHTVSLGDVAANCMVQNNGQSVNVPFEGTAPADFTVECTARTGSIEVTASTTGDDQDDQYDVLVDGNPVGTILANETKAFPDIDEGTHTVSLGDVASNCMVTDNGQSVTVNFDQTSPVNFTVECSEILSDLTVETTTSGATPDPDGYTVTLDGGSSRSLGLDDSTTYAGIASTDHTVELTGLATNCSVINGNNPRTVTVPEGTGTTEIFDVDCP